jgi:hypothetical protein
MLAIARLALAATTLALLALLAPAARAASVPPQHERDTINLTLAPDPGLTAACGYEIDTTYVGTIDTTTLFDASGTAVSKIVTFPGWKTTFTNPATGVSITTPSVVVSHVDLLTGDVTFTGLTGHLHLQGAGGGQQAPDVGRQVFDAMGDLIAQSGQFSAGVAPAICPLLAPSA